MIAIVPCEHCGSLNGMTVHSHDCVDCGKARDIAPSYKELDAEIKALREVSHIARLVLELLTVGCDVPLLVKYELEKPSPPSRRQPKRKTNDRISR
jgi:hypothetical protein